MIKEGFQDTLSHYTDGATAEALWQELAQAYSSPNRHYHNLEHLENMYRQLLAVKIELSNWDAVILALGYHDAVYEALKKDNEAASAALAVARLRQIKAPEGLTDQVTVLILATKNHELHENPDANFFTDADLSILGADMDAYNAYALAVRKEYAVVPDALYLPGREKVLEHFLSMPQIFKTTFFRGRYEAAAWLNLQRELKALRR
jgi:predicted metal-dependent HD superfamily phosphohydrolase